MRVLLIGDYPPPVGGVAMHVQQLQRGLREAGCTVDVLDIGKGGHRGEGVEPAAGPLELSFALARRAVKDDVIHLHTSGNNLKAWWLATGVGRFPTRARKVLTVHSGLVRELLEKEPRARAWVRRGLAGFDQVVAVSSDVADALASCGVRSGSSYGVSRDGGRDATRDRLEIHPAFCASQVRAGSPPAGFEDVRRRRRPLLTMAHHPAPVYGRDLMLAALSKLSARHPDIGLALYGVGTGSPELRAEAEAHGVLDRLELIGELTHPEALAVVTRSDLFVRPTRADGDALSVREALAVGTPCVASDAALRPEGTTVVRADDVDALVEGIDGALSASVVTSPTGQGRGAPDAVAFLLDRYRTLIPGRRGREAGSRDGHDAGARPAA